MRWYDDDEWQECNGFMGEGRGLFWGTQHSPNTEETQEKSRKPTKIRTRVHLQKIY
jgi:hypothetical protein